MRMSAGAEGGGGGGAEQQVLEFLAQFSLGFKGVE